MQVDFFRDKVYNDCDSKNCEVKGFAEGSFLND